MRDCPDGEMRDQLPDYVHNTLSASARATVEEHLEACADCAEEVEVIRSSIRAYPGVKIDLKTIVKALPAAPHVARGGMLAGNQWKLAAGLGFVLIGGLTVATIGGVFSRADIATPTAAVVPAATVAANPSPSTVAPATAAAPQTVTPAPLIASTPAPAAGAGSRRSISFGGGLSDLSDDQLSELLGELDGLESLPSVEPETHANTIVPRDGGGHNAR